MGKHVPAEIVTSTGLMIDISRPVIDDIQILDIAHALSNICRYVGHCHDFYSVAEHSVLVSHMVPRQHAMWGLMHDASEAYLGDVSTPLKRQLPAYKSLEAAWMSAVAKKFGLPYPYSDEIGIADRALLFHEMNYFFGRTIPRDTPLLVGFIGCLPPADASSRFLSRFREIQEWT